MTTVKRIDIPRFENMQIEDGEPVFAEPWQAQAFALVVTLHDQGVFTWSEWAEALSREIHDRGKSPESHGDLQADYYHRWLAALEALMAERGIVDGTALVDREAAWHAAAARTPHGEPIEL